MAMLLILTSSCKKKDSNNPPETVTDIDGNVYHTITIGSQVWLAENLKTTKYNDGTSIPLVKDSTTWLNLITPGYCYYKNDDATYKNTYGALYNWFVVNTGKLAPIGWHVPSNAEWTILIDFLGGESVAGGKMKENGTSHWFPPNTGATNISGFSALPGGNRGYAGSFYAIGAVSFWWTSTDGDNNTAWGSGLNCNGIDEDRFLDSKRYGFSVRCVRDY